VKNESSALKVRFVVLHPLDVRWSMYLRHWLTSRRVFVPNIPVVMDPRELPPPLPHSTQQSSAAADARTPPPGSGAPSPAFLGSMLFTRCVSGTRVVPRGQLKSVGGVDFAGYGASVADYPHDYLTAACALGLSSGELEEFSLRLDKALRKAREEKTGALAASLNGAGAAKRATNGLASVEARVLPDSEHVQHAGVHVKGVAGDGGQDGEANGGPGSSASRSNGDGAGHRIKMRGIPPEALEPAGGRATGDGEEDWDGVD